MKQILIILGLFASITTFAQSPRIKLNQITKDTVKGSVLISSPSDSGMVYSRDFYIAYGLTDTVLILYGDTLAATSGIISSVLSDGVTITGDGTTGNELKVDTSLIATLTALNDSLATVPTKTTPDSVTITGDGSVANPLKVDTATVISTIQGLVDTLSARGYLTANQTITISGDVTGSGTTSITATVVDDSHDHIISNVDFLQDSLNIKINTDFSNVTGTLPVANGGTGATTLTGAGIVTGTGTTNYLPKFTSSNAVGNSNLINDASGNLGLGVTPSNWSLTPSLQVKNASIYNQGDDGTYITSNAYYDGAWKYMFNSSATQYLMLIGKHIWKTAPSGSTGNTVTFTEAMTLNASGNLGIGETSPSAKLDVNGNGRFRSIGSGASAGALHYTSTGVLTTNTSDVRLKTNLQPLENTLNKLLGINTYTFNWINETDRVDLGMVAQEVEQIFPNLVFTNSVDGYKGIHYDKFSSILTKAIQEQQEQIETLQIELDAKSLIIETQQIEINQLKNLITDLTNRLIILENK